MKGITPVIAIILLLLITVAMVGFAMVWFQGFIQTAGQGVDTKLKQDIATQGKQIQVSNIDVTSEPTKTIVSVTNKGSYAIQSAELSFFINGTRAVLESCTPSAAQPGDTIDCTVNKVCESGFTLKVVAPGNDDLLTC